MVSADILNSHPIKTLKSEISKTNIKGYSKMKKDEIIDLMLKYKSRFSHIKKKEKKPKGKKEVPKIEVPKITITEAEPEKRKVYSRGGRFFKPKEPKSKLPPIPKSNIKIRLPKETKPKDRKVEHKKGFRPNTKEQKKELEEVEKIVKDNKNNFIIPKDYNRVSSLIDKFKLYSNNKLNKTKFQYKFTGYRRAEEKSSYLTGTKEINEVEISYEIYNKDLSLYKTITTNLKDKTGEFYKIKEPYPHNTIFKLKLENEKEEPKKEIKKEDFKFNEKFLKIESQTWGTVNVMSITFFNENENVYIEFTLRKGMVNSLLFLEHLSSQFEKKNPRAQKGYTRGMVCHIINKLLKEKLVKEDSKFGLIAGDIGGITGKMERTHNIKNLVKMYKSMGFKTKPGAVRGQQQMETTVENVLKWCNTKYKL